ncbi:RNA polymerase Rpb7 [Gigaspora rosea]|uniref:RNA polymerase Rpb7 n=5 Tax=Gigasporaceae TaxID=36753 RepID=A0A397UKJ5_9GLOM|nr:RNA polymerase Rpb7 [Gigaspora rosea]
MFFIKKLTHTIQLHPSYFTQNYQTFLAEKLYADVEGTCTGRYGYIIAVLDSMESLDISKGKVIPSIGLAEFEVKYRAVVFKPFKGEVVDGVVSQVNKMGFFADVGPLQVFVSSHLIPSDLKFDASKNPPAYHAEDGSSIEKGYHVRIKIVGTRFDATDIFAIGTIKDDFCGVQLP